MDLEEEVDPEVEVVLTEDVEEVVSERAGGEKIKIMKKEALGRVGVETVEEDGVGIGEEEVEEVIEEEEDEEVTGEEEDGEEIGVEGEGEVDEVVGEETGIAVGEILTKETHLVVEKDNRIKR